MSKGVDGCVYTGDQDCDFMCEDCEYYNEPSVPYEEDAIITGFEDETTQ